MQGEFKRTLTVTKNEQDIIEELMDIGEAFGLNFEETPGNLFEIVYAISMRNPKAWLYGNEEPIDIKYQDD